MFLLFFTLNPWKNDYTEKHSFNTIGLQQIVESSYTYVKARDEWLVSKNTYSKNGTNISYTYDSDGLRTSKTVNGVKHNYYYVDGQLRYERNGDSFAYQISLKYRGYVYDNETGLYYLQSRYYASSNAIVATSLKENSLD